MFSARIQQLAALLGEFFIYREVNFSLVNSSCRFIASCGVVQTVIRAQPVSLNASLQIHFNARIIAIHIAASHAPKRK
jgi:hypothetical protein